jgi:hypothetical protein
MSKKELKTYIVAFVVTVVLMLIMYGMIYKLLKFVL